MAEATEPFILIVEDDPDHAALIEAAFKKSLAHARTHLVLSGWEARAYLARESPHHDWERCPAPSLIVLDLGLPDITGFEILEWMAEWEWLAKIPVIVFTGSEDPEHERRAVHPHCRGQSRPSCANPGGVRNDAGPKQDSCGVLWLGSSGVPQ